MLLIPALLLGVYGWVEIVRGTGDWVSWAWALTGTLGVVLFVWGEMWRSRQADRRRQQMRDEYRATEEWLRKRQEPTP